jgi:uncharacterized membrane protein
MPYRLSQPVLDRLFRLGVVFKGLDGVVEALVGVVLLVVPTSQIQGKIAVVATNELQEGKHAFIANYVLQLDSKFDPHIQLFAAIYLLVHGLLKVGLAVALLKRWWALYPYAMGFLLAFILYQAYRIGFSHSVLLTVLTAIDCLVLWLVYQEWKRHRQAVASVEA